MLFRCNKKKSKHIKKKKTPNIKDEKNSYPAHYPANY